MARVSNPSYPFPFVLNKLIWRRIYKIIAIIWHLSLYHLGTYDNFPVCFYRELYIIIADIIVPDVRLIFFRCS